MPRNGMNGTPFSAACRPAWMAGQVAVPHLDLAGLDGGREARRQTVLAERNGRRLDARDAARANQHVDLEAALRHGDDVQVAHRPAHQGAHGCHGAAGVIGRQGDARAVRDAVGESLQAEELRGTGTHLAPLLEPLAQLGLEDLAVVVLRQRVDEAIALRVA